MDERDLNKTTVPLGKSETHNPPFPKDTHCVNIQNDVWDVLNFEIIKLLKEQNEELSKKVEKLEKKNKKLKEENEKLKLNLHLLSVERLELLEEIEYWKDKYFNRDGEDY